MEAASKMTFGHAQIFNMHSCFYWADDSRGLVLRFSSQLLRKSCSTYSTVIVSDPDIFLNLIFLTKQIPLLKKKVSHLTFRKK